MLSKAAGLALRLALPLLSALIFFATGEAALRAIYRGGGRLTLGAPGGGLFEHLTVHDQQRGRLEWGEKTAGVPRVMILGDSITWGTGIRQWQDTWPEQLARQLEAAGRPHQFAVLSLPGREIDAHIAQFASWAHEVQPDVLVYQWYVNDIEIVEHRPSTERRWHRLPWHGSLLRTSYLYYFLDNRLQRLLRPPERSYVEYILTDFIPGSVEWTEFERDFHGLATRAREVAPVRLLLLYPQVPFTGPYPLQSIHDRMKALAAARTISIPPIAWRREVGAIVARPDAPWKQAVRLPAHAGRTAVVTHAYYTRRALDLTVTFAAEALDPGAVVATVSAIDPITHATVVSAPLVAQSSRGLQTARLHLGFPDNEGREVQVAVGATAEDVEVASIDLEVDYGFHVLDLTDTMNTFDTHVSVFDAHPNAQAHKVVAQRVAAELTRLESAGR
ncbi:MAG: hypothetical protein LC791_13165 [Acidobacteria bacterium]|nr:hypothetical protein [Acidobacteriota bacterium]